MVWHKVLPVLVMPLGVCLWMSAVGVWRKKAWMVWVGLAVLWVGSMEVTGDWLMAGLERPWPRVRAEEVEECDAVVVLGGYAHRGAGPGLRPEFTEAADRLMTGVELMEAGKGRVIVLESGAEWVRARLGAERVIELRRLANTAEEMEEVRRLGRVHGWKRMALVTSAFHMTRAAGLARGQGLTVVPVASDWMAWMDETRVEDFVPRGEGLRKTETALREWMGLGYSLVRGQWRPGV